MELIRIKDFRIAVWSDRDTEMHKCGDSVVTGEDVLESGLANMVITKGTLSILQRDGILDKIGGALE